MAFLNTDNLSFANETVNGNSFHNEGESKIIKLVRDSDVIETEITINYNLLLPQFYYLLLPQFIIYF